MVYNMAISLSGARSRHIRQNGRKRFTIRCTPSMRQSPMRVCALEHTVRRRQKEASLAVRGFEQTPSDAS